VAIVAPVFHGRTGTCDQDLDQDLGRPARTAPRGTLNADFAAYAQSSPFGSTDMLTSLLPFVLIFVIMYFLILRRSRNG